MELNLGPSSKKEKVDHPHFIRQGYGPININAGNQNDIFPQSQNVFP